MQQPPLILVIEDDSATRQFIVEVCCEEGYQVLAVGDTLGVNSSSRKGIPI